MGELSAFETQSPTGNIPARNGGVGLPASTATLYADNGSDAAMEVHSLTFAHLAAWMPNGASAVADFRHFAFPDNVVLPPLSSANIGEVFYNMQGDFTYKEIRFYPIGTIYINFTAGKISDNPLYGSSFGSDLLAENPALMVPDGQGQMRPVNEGDFFIFAVEGIDFADGGFSLTGDMSPFGFFGDLRSGANNGAIISGRFHDGGSYNRQTAPAELSAEFSITDSNGAIMRGGFLGKSQ